jgi:hypothetical protein
MIAVPTAIWAHYVGDAGAWLGAAAMARWQYRRWPALARNLSHQTGPGYFLALAICAVIGAWLIGSFNLSADGRIIPSHSIAGALAGGIVGAEAWKWRRGIRQSTGGAFVAPLCVGIVIGRLGCFFSGLPDRTFGIATGLPWAADLGDGIGRHPVQLYESLSMAAFLTIYLAALRVGRPWARDHAFHAMICVYAAQRFLWEFLKPYPRLIGPFNLFHLLMLGLFVYGLVWWRRGSTDNQPAVAGAV